MAQFNSDQMANLVAVPRVFGRPADNAGRVRIARAHYLTNGDAAGSVWWMSVLPWNARVIQSVLQFGAMTGLVTATLDDGVASGRWGTATSMAAAGTQTLFPTLADAKTAVPTAPPADSSIIGMPKSMLAVVLTTAAAGVTGAVDVVLSVFYIVD